MQSKGISSVTRPSQRVLCVAMATSALVVCALIFGKGIDNHLVSDDWRFLYQVAEVSSVTEMAELLDFGPEWFVRPTQWLLTWAMHRAFGTNPAPYHIASIVMHLCNAALLSYYASQLIRRYSSPRPTDCVAAVLIGVVFALNWRHHEVVFWYSAINEELSALFRISALLAVQKWLELSTRRTHTWPMAAVVGVLFSLALLSKESALVFPAELVLLLALRYVRDHRRGEALSTYGALLLPTLIVSGVWLLAYRASSGAASLASIQRSTLRILEAAPLEWLLRWVQFFNGCWIGTASISSRIPLVAFEATLLIGLVLAAALRRRWLWLYALAWTLLSVLPYVAIVSQEAMSLRIPILTLGVGSDRFLYLPAAAAALLTVASLGWFSDEAVSLTSRFGRIVAVTVPAAVLLFLALANGARLVRLENEWDVAGEIGHTIVRDVTELLPDPGRDSFLCLLQVPDNYKGKYVFRNGLRPALYIAYGSSDFYVDASIKSPSSQSEQTNWGDGKCRYVFEYDSIAGRVSRVR